MTLRLLAVLPDIHPRGIVARGEQYFVVTHPECALDETRPLPAGRFEAMVAKHDYEALSDPIEVDDSAALRAILEEYVDRG